MRTRIIAGLAIVLTALAPILDNWVWWRLQRETADERKLTRFPWPGTREPHLAIFLQHFP